MPLLNFKKQFADMVESGEKRQTIRAHRKNGRDPKSGDILYLYSGLKTKRCRKLRESKCKKTAPICIDKNGMDISVWIGGADLSILQIKQLARRDGFNSIFDFYIFFGKKYGFPFRGLLIEW